MENMYRVDLYKLVSKVVYQHPTRDPLPSHPHTFRKKNSILIEFPVVLLEIISKKANRMDMQGHLSIWVPSSTPIQSISLGKTKIIINGRSIQR